MSFSERNWWACQQHYCLFPFNEEFALAGSRDLFPEKQQHAFHTDGRTDAEAATVSTVHCPQPTTNQKRWRCSSEGEPMLSIFQVLGSRWLPALSHTSKQTTEKEEVLDTSGLVSISFLLWCELQQVFAQHLHCFSYYKELRDDSRDTRGCAWAICKHYAILYTMLEHP